MRNTMPVLLFMIVAPFALGCQSTATGSQNPLGNASPQPANLDSTPAAYLNGKAVTQAELYRALAPAHGGEALAEILLDRAVKQRLQQETITLDQADLDAEKQRLLTSLNADPDQAARLLREMRDQRGLDEKRFEGMLRRNAGLRALIRDQVTINDAAINQAYALRYGKRYRVRLITTGNLDALTRARRQVLSGASFTDLAINLSTDISASQGGLLSPISPADPTYPKAIRDALPKLAPDTNASRLSSAIALDQGYALLWLEGIETPDNPPTLDAARVELEAAVRSDLERIRMRQLARTLIEQTDIVVLDPLLDKAWKRQRNSIERP
jgi:parvulin-like peptidyl-prolyl isomerase